MKGKAKHILILMIALAASAAITAFIFLASSSGTGIQTARAPFLNRLFSFFVNTSITTQISASSTSIQSISPSQPALSQQGIQTSSSTQKIPAGFKGPTGAPHIKGPTSNPPHY